MAEKTDLVLITGGAGFIGTHLCRHLMASGYRLRVLDVAAPRIPVPGVEYLRGDVRALADAKRAVQGASAVFHLAAMVSVPLCQENPTDSYDTNLLGTQRMLDATRLESAAQGAQLKFFFASSSAVYGAIGQRGKPLNEDSALPPPLSFYGAQKLGSEQMIALYHDFFGVPALPFRFFNVYGPGQDPSSPYSGVVSIFTARAALKQPLTVFGDGQQTRDFVSVHDVVDACRRALELPARQLNGRPLNLGCGTAITVEQLAQTTMSLAGATLPLQKKPARAADIQHSLGNIERAKELLGWAPKISLEAGLAELLEASS